VDGDLLVVVAGEFGEAVFGDGEHAAGAAGSVVEDVGGGFDAVGDGEEDEVGHEADDVAWGEVFAGFFVIFFVEAADELFEDGAHGVVVEGGEAF